MVEGAREIAYKMPEVTTRTKPILKVEQTD